MHLYTGASSEFIADSTHNRIASKLEDSFFREFRYRPPQSEVRSWRNSLRAVSTALDLGGLHDQGVIVEYQLPLSSKRLDCMITGTDQASRPGAVVIELKQWDQAERSWIEECVTVSLGGGQRDVLHPSRQVGNYQRYLLDVHTAFSDGGIALAACSYLHNFQRDDSSELLDHRHHSLLEQYPLFAGDQVDDLVAFLDAGVGGGAGGPVLDTILEGHYRPHKRLLDHTAKVIRNEPTYVLLDEQQVSFNAVLAKVRAHQLSSEKSAFLIQGGPGTGKSVIAVNLVAELSAQGYVVQHATGSKAFTENLRKVVGSRAAAQFSYFNSFTKMEGDSIDVLILDESHRIRAFSWNRFTPKAERSELPQIFELIDAARTTVFFIDDMQVVRPGEVGSSDLIRAAAAERGVPVYEFKLEAQFRCGGSESFVNWVENTLELRRTADVLLDPTENFDFDVVDSPEELDALIRARAEEGFTARLTAGFCWPWSKPNSDGTLVEDVVLDGWSRPWNAKPDAGRLAEGIPKSNFWASDPGGIEQVGCVYTAQGFEYDYAGVIVGRDLVYRPRDGWVGQPEFSKDTIVRRAGKRPEEFLSLVKNTYRVLLTRGLRGCYLYFEDAQTRDFILSRVEVTRRR